MANEITVSTSLAATKSFAEIKRERLGYSVTMTNAKANGPIIQNVGTSEEALNLGDISTSNLGWCHLRNLDATNYVTVRAATGAADLIRMNAGETACFRMATGITPYIIANTAACNVEITLLET